MTEHLPTINSFLSNESSKGTLAASSLFVLVEWSSLLLQQVARSAELWAQWGHDTIKTHARLLEKTTASKARGARKHSALTATWRALRAIMRSRQLPQNATPDMIDQLTAKGSTPNAVYAPMLGAIAGVAHRLPACSAMVKNKSQDYCSFYTREIVGSRATLPDNIADGLLDFFAHFAGQDLLQDHIMPAMEKSLLRAPEVVLDDLIRPLTLALPKYYDLSICLQRYLFKPLMTNVKSSNAKVREGAVQAFQIVASRSHDDSCLNEILDELLKSMKDAKSAEHRSMYATMISALKPLEILAPNRRLALAQIASKEANEAALSAETKALSVQISQVLSSNRKLDPAVSSIVAQSLNDKKSSTRRTWSMCCGEVLRSLTPDQRYSDPAVTFAKEYLDTIRATLDEISGSPIPSAQSGLAIIAYVTLTVQTEGQEESDRQTAAGKKLDMRRHLVSNGEKPPYLLNHRVYSKFVSREDGEWLVRALSFIGVWHLTSMDVTAQSAWAQAVVFSCITRGFSSSVRRNAKEELLGLHSHNPSLISKLIIEALWGWIHNLMNDDRDTPASAAQVDRNQLYQVVQCICNPLLMSSSNHSENSSAIAQKQYVSLLVLCRPLLLPRTNWIDMCLRAKVDPQMLVQKNLNRCLEELLRCTESNLTSQSTRNIHQAACDAAADLAFVASDAFLPVLTRRLQDDLDSMSVQDIGPTEAAIYHTPDDVTFVDVLAGSDKQDVPEKNAKDYNTLKWEQEIRSQLSKKQGQQKKLSPDEKSKIKAQLEKEAKIRLEVTRVVIKLRRGIGIIKSLARSPPLDPEPWMALAINSLLAVVSSRVSLLVGHEAALAYLSLAGRVSNRLGPLKSAIGVATLRAQQQSQLADDFKQEPLGDLVTRILYRLRLSSEQRPFDPVSLLYILPLISAVLANGGIGRSPGDEADEQVTLAIECLSFHMDQLSNQHLPRRQTCQLLVHSMQRYGQHYRTLKDSILSASQAIAADASSDEIDVFLKATLLPQVSVRQSALQAIDNDIELQRDSFYPEIYLACHDDDQENSDLALDIWGDNTLSTTSTSSIALVPYLESKDMQLRNAAARSISASVNLHQSSFASLLDELKQLYLEKAKPRVAERDAYGMPRKTDLTDPWDARHGIALAIRELASKFDPEHLVSFMTFMVERGPLADKNPQVRDMMVEAATQLVSKKGSSKLEELMSIYQTTLDAPNSSAKDSDLVNEAIIILYGALARHLNSSDSRVQLVIDKLLTTLATPSESVQYAICGCLPPLVRLSQSQTSEQLARVLDDLLHSKKYATRRGAAYGVAGIINGRGIGFLREARIMSTLRAASEEKKDQVQRQGAFLAYELLSSVLGPMFEPYVVQIVPQLLAGFGDSSADVREACLDAAKTCFATLSSFGVKQVLPMLLEGLDEQQWRSKKGACDSLGAMAYLDPQQLAISLPDIIPPLTTVLNDSHKEVRGAANRSLQRFGDVISNPEVKGLVDILLKALSDPVKYTEEALDSLLKVSFVHYLDAPSLALIVRILERGLGDRSATKRKGSQIIGSLAHLADRKDLTSHLPVMVSGLRVAAIDPVPATRATSSKALGSLVEKLGEDALPDLIPSLMAALKTDTGASDRLGSAQALSEVLAGLGIGRLEETLPSILQNVTSAKAAVREGFMSLFIYLPACFGNSFANYLSRIIPPVLSGLADEVESIRETSLRAGRLLVKNFATRAIELLLPELQRGLGNDSYRIRLSSVELVGDLLFNLTGISTKSEDDDDDLEEGAAAAGNSLLEVLGEEKRNNILSALYISRCDTSGLVRAAAMNVWKALVSSPRTARDITPTLSQLIIRRLASSNPEQKHIAGNALGELVRKAGEGALASLLPTLEEGLETSVDTDAKQGICIALKELISSASMDFLENQESKLITVVRTALLDSDPNVREAAAEAFDSLQRIFGRKVVDHILPSLLGLLRDEGEAQGALAALLTLLAENSRSNIILPNLLPTLTASPISAFNARALASLASVAGSAMTRRMQGVLQTLLDNAIDCKDSDRQEALDGAFDAVMLSTDEYDGLNMLMSIMLALVKHDDHRKRRLADLHLAHFFAQTDIDYSRYHADLIRALLISFDDRDSEVVKAAWTALSTMVSKLRKEEMESLVGSTKQVLNHIGVRGHNLPGFLLPKGINAVLPIFLQGLINGSPDQRTQSAVAISDMIDKTSGDALKPFVTNITGPLIRVVSERSVDVKAAILVTLNQLLEKIPTFIKPFLPQLQRTFTKALADPTSSVLRLRAAKAIGTLISLTPRIDPLIGELVTGSKTSDAGVRSAMQNALYQVICKVGGNMNEASRNAIIALIDEDSATTDEATEITNARLLGALIKNLPHDTATGIIKSRVLTSHFTRGSVLALNAAMVESAAAILKPYANETVLTICRGIGNSDTFITENCVLAAGKYLLTESSNKSYEATKPLFDSLVPVVQPGSPIDSRRLGMVVIRTVSREHSDIARSHMAVLAPPVFASVRDPIIPVKLAAEAAFLALFCVVDEESAVFDKYLAGPGANLPPNTKRSMQDYFKRVATRLASQARERNEAEGGQDGLGLSNDEKEDEREIWSVGKVDLGEASFDE
ncbi:MAG: translational activator of GCN4 [Chrysothrix sp. TS-e1954]|nr:MAG: translational activator of GCN4 [Chrysothrix sp. TS-e1954]